MEKTPIPKLLLKLAPPVMLSLLIQSVYNLVDSFFIGRYSETGLTALSILYPIQLLMTALATGIGAGAGILLSRADGEKQSSDGLVGSLLIMECLHSLIFTGAGLFGISSFLRFSTDSVAIHTAGKEYSLVFIFSIGIFLQSGFEKLLQARGQMRYPMAGQIAGAVVNMILDPLFIFGFGIFPSLGVRGAAIATITGQFISLLITAIGLLSTFSKRERKTSPTLKYIREIYRAGTPSILMQSLYTFYIIGLNLILGKFTEEAITVLGIYYKLQTFLFIPMMGLQQVILPVISHNYGAGKFTRVKETLRCSILFSSIMMIGGTVLFAGFPKQLTSIFSSSETIQLLSIPAYRIIALSFIPAAIVMMLTVYFQGITQGGYSMSVTVLRQIFLLVPLAWLFHFAGLTYVWLTFPVTEGITLIWAVRLYYKSKHLLS